MEAEAKLNAIEHLKIYNQKHRLMELSENSLEDVSKIYKHTLNKLGNIDLSAMIPESNRDGGNNEIN